MPNKFSKNISRLTFIWKTSRGSAKRQGPTSPWERLSIDYKHRYFVKLYFCLIPSFSSSERLLKYAFQPGQKLMCHLQNLPTKEVGLASSLSIIVFGVTYVEVINFHKITFRFYAIKSYATKLIKIFGNQIFINKDFFIRHFKLWSLLSINWCSHKWISSKSDIEKIGS